MSDIELRAQRGYNAYGDYVGWKNYAGHAMPTWVALPEKIRSAWKHSVGVLLADHDDSKTPSFANFAEVFARIAFILTGQVGEDVADTAQKFVGNLLRTPDVDIAAKWREQYPEQVAEISAEQDTELRALVWAWYTYSRREPGYNPAGPGMTHGVYDHFKGGVYLSTDVWEWASGKCEPVVSYISLVYGRKFTRLAHEWQSIVRWPDGQYRSRFVYRGPDLNTPEPSFKVRKES